MVKEYFIPGSTPSLKNSKVKTSKGIFMSKTCKNYLASLNITYYSSRDKEVKIKKGTTNKFLEAFEGWVVPDKQIVLGFHFVRGSRHSWDLGNISQIIMDLMTAHKLIFDDNMDWIVPQAYKKDGKYYSYNKETPGVYIKIIEE